MLVVGGSVSKPAYRTVRCASVMFHCGVPVRHSTKTEYNSVCRKSGDRLVFDKTLHFSRDWKRLFVTESD